jgi:hypothetical protein
VDPGPDPRFEDFVRHVRESGEEALVGRETAAREVDEKKPAVVVSNTYPDLQVF